MPLFKRISKEERFWAWFQKNSSRLFAFEQDQEAVFDDLDAALSRVAKGLTFEFGPVEDGKREFIVSAGGIQRLFPAVQQLVHAAPNLSCWLVIPFRPPKSLDYTIEFPGFSVGADDVWFGSEPDRGRIGLTLYIRGLTEHNDTLVGQATYILLDNALGEYTVETQVGYIERKPLPENPEALGLTSFRNILELFDTTRH